MNASAAEKEQVVIKKYANRRLYDTETSAYITLEDLCDRVKQGREFVVKDAKTGHDLTRQVLTQIIFEQETKGYQLLPTSFLRSVIGFYDNNMQGVMQHYLDASMNTFVNSQSRMQGMMGKAVNEFSPFTQIEEMTRQNMAFMEKAMTMFTPFGGVFSGNETQAEEKEEPVAAKRNSRR